MSHNNLIGNIFKVRGLLPSRAKSYVCDVVLSDSLIKESCSSQELEVSLHSVKKHVMMV